MGVVVGLAVGKPVVGVALGFAKKQGQGLLKHEVIGVAEIFA